MRKYILVNGYCRVKINFLLVQFKNIGAKVFVANRPNTRIQTKKVYMHTKTVVQNKTS
jgi:hypothetical protein